MSREFISCLLLVGGLSLSALSLGCTCSKTEEKGKHSPSAQAAPEAGKRIDEDFLEKLKAAAKACQTTKEESRVTCNGGEKNEIVLSFNKGERKRIASLPTLTRALQEKDEKLQTLAASVLYASFRVGLGDEADAKSLTKEEAQALLEATLALPPGPGMQAVPAATHAMMLTDQGDLLQAALKAEVPAQVRTMSYRFLMVYGRLKAFDRVKELSRDPSAAIVLSAIESPRNMKDWSEAEQAAICPWAVSFLDDARAPVSGNATAVLSRCAGEHLEVLLGRVEESLKKKEFSFIHSTALRDMCGAAPKRGSFGASEEQCLRVRKIQENAIQSDSVQPRVRAMSLSAVAYSWPDQQSLDLAKKLSTDKEPDVTRAATQVVNRLTPRLKAAAQGAVLQK